MWAARRAPAFGAARIIMPQRSQNMNRRTWGWVLAVGSLFSLASSSDAQVLYFTREFGPVMRANLNRDRTPTLVAESNTVVDVTLDLRHDHLYWANRSPGFINRSNLNGSDRSRVVTAPDGIAIRSVHVDSVNERLYWTEEPDSRTGEVGKIRRANLDGTNREDIYFSAIPEYELGRLVVDPVSERIYWREFVGGVEIRHANFDGSDVVTVVEGFVSTLGDFNIDRAGGKLWWARRRIETGILRSDLDGAGTTTVLSDVFGSPLAIADSDRKLYFVTRDADRPRASVVSRMNLDGSGFEQALDLGDGFDVLALAVDDRAPGDCSGDEKTSGDDVAAFISCMTGPGGPVNPHCLCADATGDRITDLADFAEFQVAFGRSK